VVARIHQPRGFGGSRAPGDGEVEGIVPTLQTAVRQLHRCGIVAKEVEVQGQGEGKAVDQKEYGVDDNPVHDAAVGKVCTGFARRATGCLGVPP
jgi:hypothetical protein